MMLTQDQLTTMLSMQDEINRKVNINWLTAGYPWLRAAALEAGEAIEHHGWKWWKKQVQDTPQLQIELVDIWHFYLSAFVEYSKGNHISAAEAIASSLNSPYMRDGIVFDGKHYTYVDMLPVERIELLMGLSVGRRTSVALFEAIMTDAGLTWADLNRQYIGKNVLNMFRQNNGYKDGTYIKMWPAEQGSEVEDNVYLARIMATTEDPVAITKALTNVYAQVLALRASSLAQLAN